MATEPIVYRERLPQVAREFRLFHDRVEIHAKWTLGKHFTDTVRLKDLSPQARSATIRNRWFKRAILVASLGVAVAVVFTRPHYATWLRRAAGFGWIVAVGASGVAALTFRKRQFLHFPRKDGRPGLDLCRSDAPAYSAFEQEVRRRIQRA